VPQQTDAATERNRIVGRVLARDLKLPQARPAQQCQQLEQRCFTRPVVSQQRQNLALRNVKGDVLKRRKITE